MAWTQKLASGKFRGLYRDQHGKQHSVGTFVRKREAELAASRSEGLARNDARVLSTLTFGEWVDQWWPTRQVAASTAREDRKRLDGRVLAKWGTWKLSDITTTAVQAWTAELSTGGLSASSVTRHIHLLSAAMKAAAAGGLIAVNPCRGVVKPKPNPSPERYLTREEAAAIRERLNGVNLLLWDLLIETGCRWGEGIALHWDHIDFEQKRVEVALSWDRQSELFKSPKSYQKRWVPLSAHLAEVLGERLDAAGYGTTPSFDYQAPRPRYGLILAGPSGLPWAPTNFAHAISKAGEVATVGEGARRRTVGHVRPHDLRHTYASWLVQAGVPLQAVQSLLGHGSIVVTERYARMMGGGHWDAVRAVLDQRS